MEAYVIKTTLKQLWLNGLLSLRRGKLGNGEQGNIL